MSKSTRAIGLAAAAAGMIVTQPASASAPAAAVAAPAVRTLYKTETVDGLKVFYREAGDPSLPTIVLLHGFPTSSHMFRDLIPALAGRFHVIAPDYIGFGQSDAPTAEAFIYSFDN